MHQYVFRRLLLFIPTLILITLAIFLLMSVIPGDPARFVLAGQRGEGSYTEEDLRKLRHEMGTDRALHIQYVNWVWGLLRGDLGKSLFFRSSIKEELKPRIALTIELAVMGVLISFIVAVPLGVLSAIKQNTLIDYATRVFTFTGISIPTFVTAIAIIYLLVEVFNYLPPLRYANIWDDPWKNLQQLIFPSLSLAFTMLCLTSRVTRSAMLEVMREDYVRTARAKGLRERKVIFLHALRNAMLPVVTVSGWSLGLLLGGAVVTEKVFAISGLGSLLLIAIESRDYPLISAIILFFALAVLAVNLVVDLIYAWLDPRIRYA